MKVQMECIYAAPTSPGSSHYTVKFKLMDPGSAGAPFDSTSSAELTLSWITSEPYTVGNIYTISVQ
jgi:hypothetical protein